MLTENYFAIDKTSGYSLFPALKKIRHSEPVFRFSKTLSKPCFCYGMPGYLGVHYLSGHSAVAEFEECKAAKIPYGIEMTAIAAENLRKENKLEFGLFARISRNIGCEGSSTTIQSEYHSALSMVTLASVFNNSYHE